MRPRTAAGWALAFIGAAVLFVAVLAGVLRYGVLAPQARLLIEARVSGLMLGRVGKLKIEGLGGDVWKDFSIRQLTVSDEHGVWLDAEGLDLRWDYGALLHRRLQVSQLKAQSVTVIRRPSLAPKGPPSQGLPVAVDLKGLQFRLRTLPAFSTREGLYDISGRLKLARAGNGEEGEIRAQSLTHLGDYLAVRFDVGPARPLVVYAKALEARGGAFAGALGLPADQSFSIDLNATGAPQGQTGRLDLDLFSGQTRPLWAHGGWTSQGGVIAGRVTLAASSLTRGYQKMFGAYAIASAAGRRAPGGQYGVALRIRAQNLALAAQGPFDPATTSSRKGLQLAVQVNDLSRVVKTPSLGPGTARGLLIGDSAAWRFLGTAEAQRASYDGYRLEKVSGPVVLASRGKELTVQAKLAGAGGAGSSWLASLGGASPRLSVDLIRLKDGRMLIREADLKGQGLEAQAAGSMGLLGGLSFTGSATVSGLERARPGTAGSLVFRWSASQGKAASPWVVSADGHGEGFRSGMAELDRLLGETPKFQLKAALADGAVELGQAAVDGAMAAIQAKGVVGRGGVLALKTSWHADGPFRIGPVAIDGKASGDGSVTGTLESPKAELDASFGKIDAPDLPLTGAHVKLTLAKGPQGLLGDIAVTGDSAYGPARGRSGFQLVSGGLDLTGLQADAGGVEAAGSLSLRGSAPSTADLKLAIGPGAVLTQGRIAGTLKITDGGTPQGVIDLSAQNAAFRGEMLSIRAGRLTGSGALSRMPFQLVADAETPQGPLSIKGSGLYQQAGGVIEADINGSGAFRQVEFHTLEPIALRLQGQDRSARLRVALGGGRLDLDGHAGPQGATVATVLQDVELKAIDPDFTGRVDAKVNLQGKGSALGGAMTAELRGARSIDAPADVAVNAEVKAALAGERLTLDAQASGAKGLTSTVSLVLPVQASAAPLHLAIVRNRPMQGHIVANGEVKPIWDLFYGGDRELGGQVRLTADLGGTLADPQITGQAQVSGGRLDDFASGLVLTNLQANATLGRDQITLESLSAKDEKTGTVDGSGTLSLARGGGSSLKLNFRKFRLIDNDDLSATASGQATFTRTADGKVRVQGALDIDRAEINAQVKLRPSVVSMEVVERGLPDQQGVGQLRPQKPDGPPIALDVRLRAARGVFIKGRGLDAELSLEANVLGTFAKPQLTGRARVYQGSYEFAGKRFDFDERGQITLANSAEQIRLDLSATWEGPSLSATVRIAGTAAKPQITLTSTPSLPQSEIMSQVLFGSSASQLSGAQTAQLASTATALASGGGFDVLGSLRQFAGLDRLSFGGDQTSGLTVAGGKYIGDNVYLEVIGGGRQGPSAEVDWRVRRHLSLVSTLSNQLGAKIGVRWTHDFGGPKRAQKPKSPAATAPR
jgi:translocation and assembly module TamB